MKKYILPLSFLSIVAAWAAGAAAQESVQVNYQYQGNVNLSDISPSLRIADFTDSRSIANKQLIAEGYEAEAPLAEILQNAIVQAFSKGGADLLESGEDMVIAGEVSGSELETVERGGVESYQLTIRANIQLQGDGRTIYEANLFGRARAPVSEGVVAAVHASLDRMISELTRDDYFMIELQ